ncbi:hypothetical protein V1VFAS_036 [Rhizobium phage V1VFA-S]|nr:hypothetical protein V1VFAS_036 [Rhizobium phage V1VFA-S]
MNNDRVTLKDIARDGAAFLSMSLFIIAISIACVAMKPVVLPV